MDLRPQAHDIIRTWLFSTVVRSELESGRLPWSDVAISGWVLDPDRKKMSKSKGNVVTPLPLLHEHGADAVRYWAARGRPGTDTAVDPDVMRIGRRLAIKLLNASKFALGRLGEEPAPGLEAVVVPLDRDMLSRLAAVTRQAEAALEGYDYTRALETTESFFWSFCDDYLELVKGRAYGDPADPGTASARAALALALSVQVRLFAPFLPFVTEEVWSWWQPGSVHRAAWPAAPEILPALGGSAVPAATPVLDAVVEVLGAVRREKTTGKRSMRARVARLTVTDTPARLDALGLAEGDLREAGAVDELVLAEGPELAVVAELAPEEA
jgi:valyl-tRNA synthetase